MHSFVLRPMPFQLHEEHTASDKKLGWGLLGMRLINAHYPINQPCLLPEIMAHITVTINYSDLGY